MLKIKTEDFKKALSSTKYVFTKNRMDKSINVFVFNKDYIYSINSDCCIVYPFKSNIETTIPSDLLLRVMSNYNDDEIELSFDKNLIIQGETQKSGVAPIHFNKDKFSSVDYEKEMEREDWVPLPDNFGEALNFCSFSTSKDFNMGSLSYVYVSKDFIMSFDRSRGTKFNLSSDLNVEEPFLVYFEDAKTISSFNPTHVMIDNSIHFKNKDGIYIRTSRNTTMYGVATGKGIVDANFISSLFTGTGDHYDIIIPLDLVNKILNTKVFTSDFEFERVIDVNIIDGKIFCEGKNEFGFHSVSSDLEYNGEPVSFSIHPDHFSSILQQGRKCSIYNNKLIFETKNFTHILSNQKEG